MKNEETIRESITKYLESSPPSLIHEVATGAGVEAGSTRRALYKLQAEGIVMRRDSDKRWMIGNNRALRYPAIPAHCLGKHGGWFG